MDCAILLAESFVNLSEMIARLAILAEKPGGANVLRRTIQIVSLEEDPAEGVPIGGDIFDLDEILAADVI